MRSVFFLEKRSFCAKEIFHGWDVTVVETQCETVLGGLVGKEIKVSCLQEEKDLKDLFSSLISSERRDKP